MPFTSLRFESFRTTSILLILRRRSREVKRLLLANRQAAGRDRSGSCFQRRGPQKDDGEKGDTTAGETSSGHDNPAVSLPLRA
jgi:hypothetical protein